VKSKYIEINNICSSVLHKSAINTAQINNKLSAVPVEPSYKTQGVIVDTTWPSDPSWHRMLTVGSGSIGLWYTGRINGGEGVLGACLTRVVRLFVHSLAGTGRWAESELWLCAGAMTMSPASSAVLYFLPRTRSPRTVSRLILPPPFFCLMLCRPRPISHGAGVSTGRSFRPWREKKPLHKLDA